MKVIINRPACWFHAALWPLAYAAWLVTTTAYHPTWTLRVFCTLTLVAMSAVFACVFTPRRLSFGAVAASAFALVGCGVAAALIIHVLYDLVIGPDPSRFGLTNNMVMDTAVVLFNTVCAYFLARLVERFSGRSVWRLRGG